MPDSQTASGPERGQLGFAGVLFGCALFTFIQLSLNLKIVKDTDVVVVEYSFLLGFLQIVSHHRNQTT